MAKEPTWKDLKVATANAKRWQDLGIGPREFGMLREFSREFFATGQMEESKRVWKLIEAGYSVRRILALVDVDSGLLGYLLALTKLNKQITSERLSRFADIRWKLDTYRPSEVVEWVELGLSSDQLDTLIRLDLIDECNESGLETLREVFSSLYWETGSISVEEGLDDIAALAARLGAARIRRLVESGDLASVVSDIRVADEEATERHLYASGYYGDWAGIGISQYGMDFYMTHFAEGDVDADVLVDELRFLFGLGLSHDEMYSKVQRGFRYSQVQAMRQAGLPIEKRTIEEWDGASDPKVILFFVDNGFTAHDRGDILFGWSLGIDLIEPWWEFCKKQNWITKHSRAQLISGVDYDDLATVPQIKTLDEEPAAELLDLESYLTWREYGEMHNKFTEIQRWRKSGFEPMNWRFSPQKDPFAWKKLKFSPSEAALWIKVLKQLPILVSPQSALNWKQAGVSAEAVTDWIRAGVQSPAEAAAWIRAGADAETAATRKKAGILPPSK